MPWEVISENGKFWVVKKGTHNKVHAKPHMSRRDAVEHLQALYANEDGGAAMARDMRRRRGRT